MSDEPPRVAFVTRNALGEACIDALLDAGAKVTDVFTRPQTATVADQVALDRFKSEGVQLHRVESLNAASTKASLEAAAPDALFVVGWSEIVDEDVRSVPELAAIGMHPSPLPRGRGRAPIAWNLIKGFEETALTAFHLEAEADAGDIVSQVTISIDRTDHAADLFEKVVEAGRSIVHEMYPSMEQGELPAREQDDSEATWWPVRRPHHGLIDWTQSPEAIYNWIRGQSHPYPGAYTYLDGRKVTIWQAEPPTGTRVFATPGEILGVDGEALHVAAWEGQIRLSRIEPAGDRERPASELVTDLDAEVGHCFERVRDRVQAPETSEW